MDNIIDGLTKGEYKHVVICSGAGVSTNAQIPAYRGVSGIFTQISNPQNLFKFQDQYSKILKEFHQKIIEAQPTASHQFAVWLHERGILRRVFTQNIDGLYQRAGLPKEKLIEFHGNYFKGSVILYDEPIPDDTMDYVATDLIQNNETDLLIVMGTSLQVAPFCALPNLVPKACTRVLVDREPKNAMVNPWSKTKMQIDGLYSLGGNMSSTVKIRGRRVSLRPQWSGKTKYSQQYVFEQDCDDWVNTIMTKIDKIESD